MKRAVIVVVVLVIAAAGSYALWGRGVPLIGPAMGDLAVRLGFEHAPANAAAGRPGGAPGNLAQRSSGGAPSARGAGAPPGGAGGFRGRRGPVAVSVVTAVAATRDVPILQRAVGWVEPVASVNIRPRIDGMIVSVAVQDGQMVKDGDLLFKLDDRTILAAIAKDQAQIARDTAMATQAVADAKRAADLYQRQAGAKMLAEQAEANAKATAATLQADRATLASDQIQLGYTTVRAPISGRAGTVATSVGNYVRVADTGNTLVNIVQVAPVRVSFAVPERELDAFRAALARPDSAPVRIFVASDNRPRATGKLNFIDNTVDNSTGTFTAKAEVANADGALWPGQYVTAQVELGVRRGVTVVPLVAVQQGPNGSFVYLVRPNKTVEMHKIALGETQGELAVISEGLTAGDHVVVEGQAALGNGTQVRETVQGQAGSAARPGPTRVGAADPGNGRGQGRQERVQ